MTSSVPREKVDTYTAVIPDVFTDATRGQYPGISQKYTAGQIKSKLWISEGHQYDRKRGRWMGGGPFNVTHAGSFSQPGLADEICKTDSGVDKFYTGPLHANHISTAAIGSNYDGVAVEKDLSDLDPDGATAISLCAPVNPTAKLGTTLAETMREGIPSLPGIQSWKRRTEILKAAGSEYLNYQFGWAPLVSEVHNVVDTARHHRDILQNYRHNEGSDVHRRFDFPSETQDWSEEFSPGFFGTGDLARFTGYVIAGKERPAKRVVRVVKTRKRWFEGCFTYGGPAKADNFGRHLGFGSDADALYGLSLNPDILWELTPWSWAVDWFSNTGDVINNITNFALAGLVMRYGYMMEETIHEFFTEYYGQELKCRLTSKPKTYGNKPVGSARVGNKYISKCRAPANPFGFGVGWEGLSPTQLAITAALGITRLL